MKRFDILAVASLFFTITVMSGGVAAAITVEWTDFTSSTGIGNTFTGFGAIDPTGDNVGVTFSYTRTSNQTTGGGTSLVSGTWEPELFEPDTILDASSTPSSSLNADLYGGTNAFNVSFDQTVTDPYVLMRSLGGGAQAETIDFGALSVTYLGGSLVQSGNIFIGTNDAGGQQEGAFRINGAFTSFSFTQTRHSGWSSGARAGFQVGQEVIPEPSTALLLGLGLAGMSAARRRVSR